MGRRLALVIANSRYQDHALPRLKSPEADAKALTDVLGNPRLGDFRLKILRDPPLLELRKHISRLFHDRNPDDLLMLYISGHGLRDLIGRLYLPVIETELDLLSATALPATFITDEMDLSSSRKKVLILDCCNSGAVVEGAKDSLPQRLGVEKFFRGNGSDRAILTATDSTHYAWESSRFEGATMQSRFTHFLVEGIKTGAAKGDPVGDHISLFEAFRYAETRVLEDDRGQTPRIWCFGLEDLKFSKSVLSADLAQALREDRDLEEVKRRAQDAARRLQQVATLEVRLADEADREWVLKALGDLAADKDPAVATAAAAARAGFYSDRAENLMRRRDFATARRQLGLALGHVPIDDPKLRELRSELRRLYHRCERPWCWLPQVRRKTEDRGVLLIARQKQRRDVSRVKLVSFRSRAWVTFTVSLMLGVLVGYAGGKTYWTSVPPISKELPLPPGDSPILTVQGNTRLELDAVNDLSIQRDASVDSPAVGLVPARHGGIVWWGNCRPDGERTWFRVKYEDQEGWLDAANVRSRRLFRVRVDPDDELSVREAPGRRNRKLGALPPGTRGIGWLGGCRLVQTPRGLYTWFEIRTSGLEGWVNSFYLDID